MFTTQEAVNAEISYRLERAEHAALTAQVRRPSLVRRLFTNTPKTRPSSAITRGTPLSARI
jgi:hypothetical protein